MTPKPETLLGETHNITNGRDSCRNIKQQNNLKIVTQHKIDIDTRKISVEYLILLPIPGSHSVIAWAPPGEYD